MAKNMSHHILNQIELAHQSTNHYAYKKRTQEYAF